MEIDELMIGDWVMQESGTPIRIGLRDLCAIYSGELRVKPVPLTRDILNKNNFMYDYYESCYRHSELKYDLYVTIGDDGIYEGGYQDYFYIGFGCRNVHELQHVLHSYKRKDIANNFII